MRVANSERERDREDIDKEKEIGLMNKCFSAPLAKCLGYLSSPLLEDIPGNREKKKISSHCYIIPTVNVWFN